MYDHLFRSADPDAVDDPSLDWKSNLNPDSLRTIPAAYLEPSLGKAVPGERFQFERLGYFTVDSDSNPQLLVFNRTVTLKDTWAKEQSKG
jgi:glutaminyl-tRNA synthetase